MNSVPYQYEGGPKAVYEKLAELDEKIRMEINCKRRELSVVRRRRKAALEAWQKEIKK